MNRVRIACYASAARQLLFDAKAAELLLPQLKFQCALLSCWTLEAPKVLLLARSVQHGKPVAVGTTPAGIVPTLKTRTVPPGRLGAR